MVLFIDALIVFFIMVLGLLGFRRGLIEEFGRLLGLSLASILAFSQYVKLGNVFLKVVSMDAGIALISSYVLIFLTVLFTVRIFTKLIQFMFLSKSTKWVNRLMGSFFGLTKGLLLVLVIFWVMELLPQGNITTILQKESRLAPRLKSVRQNIINIFNLDNPVDGGSEYIQKLLEQSERKDG